LRLWFTRAEQHRRTAASEFLARGESLRRQDGLEAVLELVELYPEIRSVIAGRDVARQYELGRILAVKGFTESHPIDSMVVFTKPPPH
jgi:hypothetical protein